MQEKFNQSKYISEYKKQNYKKFTCDLKKDEWEVLDVLLKEYGMNKAEFVRWAVEKLENE